MATIIEYTDDKPPANRYPVRILSPTRSGPCCFSDMRDVGGLHREGPWEFRYRRCTTCGFAVRFVTRVLPDQAFLERLRNDLKRCFVRDAP